ncbi:MAG: hypothetical protein GQ549_07600 [Gammaproteobacteria bacterium]|nr:hypothetical protein [Gammaproteobacteria bacterium]
MDDTIEDVDLRILKNFSAEQEWLCSAGDLLYLPPNVAHHGIAQSHRDAQGNEEACMTASVGYRAPSLKTITSDYINFLNENTHSTTRFTDNSPVKPAHHAEITDDTVSQFVDYLKQGLTLEHEQVKRWLGQYCSDNKAFEELNFKDQASDQDSIEYNELADIAARSPLMQSPYSNFLFSDTQHAALLFIDGSSYETSKPFAELICNDELINFQQLEQIMTADDREALLTLFHNGAIIVS